MKKYSLVFAGTPDFACPALEALVQDDQFEVKAVISQPDRPVGRKQELLPTAVKQVAEKYNLPVWQPEKIQERLEDLQKLSPDFFVVIAYGQILPKSILNIAKWNINLHGSLLPKYRGASPIQEALKNGDLETGVSVMNIEQKMDAGAVYKTHIIQIEEQDTAVTLFQKIADLGQKLPQDLIEIAEGLESKIQNEKEVTYCKKITKADAEIFWDKESANEIMNKLRAYTPWPGLFFMWKGKRVKVLSGRVIANKENEIITNYELQMTNEQNLVKLESGSFVFQTQKGLFMPLQIIPEGKKEVDFQVWAKAFVDSV